MVSDKKGYLDTSGEMAIEESFDAARHFSEGLAAVMIDGLWGFIDVRGRVVIELAFAEAYGFQDGLAVENVGGAFVQTMTKYEYRSELKGGKWGFINKCGDIVIAPVFDRVSGFQAGRAEVEIDGETRIIDDTHGEFIREP